MLEIEKDYDWISVSELAKRENITTQQVYNRIKQGQYKTKAFKRQTMNGWLIAVPKTSENNGE